MQQLTVFEAVPAIRYRLAANGSYWRAEANSRPTATGPTPDERRTSAC